MPSSKLPHGTLDVNNLANNQPASMPLYPPFPWKMFGTVERPAGFRLVEMIAGPFDRQGPRR
jgi:hypothetical protein